MNGEKQDPRTGPVRVVPDKAGFDAKLIAGIVTGAGVGVIAFGVLTYAILAAGA